MTAIPHLSAAPTTAGDWYVARERLVQLVPPEARLVIISGKVGQGKTLFAAELYERAAERRIWFAVEPEDRDADCLLTRLAATLQQQSPDRGHSLAFDQVETPTGFGAAEIQNTLVELGDTTWVLDGFDRIEDGSAGRDTLVNLIKRSPKNIRFIIATRTPVPELGLQVAGHLGCELRDHQLAMSQPEIKAYLPGVTDAETHDLANLTHGWPLALSIVRRAILASTIPSPASDTAIAAMRQSFDVFLQEQPGAVQLDLPTLSLLRQVNARFLETHNINPVVFARCGDLVSLTVTGAYRLRTDFREFLLQQPRPDLQSQNRDSLLTDAISQAQTDRRAMDALDAATQTGDIERVEGVLAEMGADVDACDWAEALRCLNRLPQSGDARTPNTALHAGRWMCEQSPAASLKLLSSAREGFSLQQDAAGELLALACAAEYWLDLGRVGPIAEFLPRLLELEAQYGDQLSKAEQSVLQVQLAGVALYLFGDLVSLDSHIQKANQLLADRSAPDERAILLCYRAVGQIMSNMIDAANETVEALSGFTTLHKEITRITIAFVRATYLGLISDNTRLQMLIQDESERLDARVQERRMTIGYFQLVNCHIASLEGRFDDVQDILARHRALDCFVLPGDVRTQGLMFEALALAATGQADAARQRLQQADELSNTPVFRLNQLMTKGTTCILLKDWAAADEALLPCVEQDFGDPAYADVASGLHAYSLYARGNDAQAQPYLQRWLDRALADGVAGLLRVGITSEIFCYLVSAAGHIASDASSFQKFLAEIPTSFMGVAFSEALEEIPVLAITTAPALEISLRDEVPALTRSQQRIVLSVALSPGQRLDRDKLLLQMWPDADNPGSRLHMQVSRMRKSFKAVGADLDQYLVVRPGELALRNARIDLKRYEERANRAELHARRGYSWLAAQVMFSAIDCWSGYLAPGVQGLPGADIPGQQVTLRYQQRCLALITEPSLSRARQRQLISTLEQLAEQEPENLLVARGLVTLYERQGNDSALLVVRTRFREGLLALDLSPSEIETQLQQLRIY